MLLGGAWTPDGEGFATAGRDKMVRVWRGVEGRWECSGDMKFGVPVTAVGWCGNGWLGVGLEDGGVEVWEGGRMVVRVDERLVF